MLKRESIRDWMKARIAHSLPGRLRLVVPGLEFIQGERRELAQELAGIPGVHRVRITVPTGGVLLEYDAGRMDASVMLEQANIVIQKYAMTVYRSRHTGRTEESAVRALCGFHRAVRQSARRRKKKRSSGAHTAVSGAPDRRQRRTEGTGRRSCGRA